MIFARSTQFFFLPDPLPSPSFNCSIANDEMKNSTLKKGAGQLSSFEKYKTSSDTDINKFYKIINHVLDKNCLNYSDPKCKQWT